MEASFRELLFFVRLGDEQAATQLVQQYEPEIRRTIRLKLRSAHVRRHFDTMDVVNSVLGNFFQRVRLGEFDLEHPQQLLKLLVTMAHNRLKDHVRYLNAGPRDRRRLVPTGAVELQDVPGREESPSRFVSNKDLKEKALARFSAVERDLFDRWSQNRNWQDIAAELGGTAEGRRKQFFRAIDRIKDELGLE